MIKRTKSKTKTTKAETAGTSAAKTGSSMVTVKKAPLTTIPERKDKMQKTATIKETANTPKEKALEEAISKTTSINVYYQFNGIEITEQEITQRIKDNWTNTGHKIGEIKELNMYIKPEDQKVYYLINGSEQGSINL